MAYALSDVAISRMRCARLDRVPLGERTINGGSSLLGSVPDRCGVVGPRKSPALGRFTVLGEPWPKRGMLGDLLGVRTSTERSLTGVMGGMADRGGWPVAPDAESADLSVGDDGAVARSTESCFSCCRRVRADMEDC